MRMSGITIPSRSPLFESAAARPPGLLTSGPLVGALVGSLDSLIMKLCVSVKETRKI